MSPLDSEENETLPNIWYKVGPNYTHPNRFWLSLESMCPSKN